MEIKDLIQNIVTIENGFNHILDAAQQIFSYYNKKDCMRIALQLYEYQAYQVRMLSVTLLGYISVKDHSALDFLKNKVSHDDNWRVQEMLAKSFDYFCQKQGYEQSLPIINEWLESNNPNVVRAVTEGLRIWISRPYFKEHPDEAIRLLSKHKSNPSEYVRKSVGNALRDISKKHPQLILKELSSWNQTDSKVHLTYQLAIKYIHKK